MRMVLALLSLSVAASVSSQTNVFVTSGTNLLEYTESGTLVGTIPIPYPGTSPRCRPCEEPRDLVVDLNGDAYIYNGTFDPFVSVYRGESGTWEHFTDPGWRISNNVSFGGIAVLDGFAFVTDNLGSRGVFRFDTNNGGSVLFGQGSSGGIDLTIGHDGLLYVVSGIVEVFDPRTLTKVRDLTLARSVRGIAVDRAGTIYGASWDGNVYRFQPDGALDASLNAGVGSLMDIDLDPCGNIYVTSRSSDVLRLDESLAAILGSWRGGCFAAFADPLRGLVPAAETVRVGSPPNANALRAGQTTGPVIGSDWDPVVDHAAFFANADLDVITVSWSAPVNYQTELGTILCPPSDMLFLSSPGTPFSISIPDDCTLVGSHLCAQAFSLGISEHVQFTNALDVVIGTF